MSKQIEIVEGDDVIYKGLQVTVEEITEENKAMIRNPDWDWELFHLSVARGVKYSEYFFIPVNISELTKID